MSAQPEAVDPSALPDRVGVQRRGEGTVLLTGPVPGSLMLGGLTPAESTALVALGTTARTPARRRRRTAPSVRWPGVLELLQRAAGRLLPVAPPRNQVVVLGEGPLPDELRRTLAPMVGRLVPEADALAALHAAGTRRPPDLVILPAVDAVAALAGRPWHARGVAQLPIVASGDLLTVGPLVRRGAGPCLGCLDLHRGARDPGWAPWLAVRAGSPDPGPELDTVPELRAAACALTALIVAGQQSGATLPAGVSLSIQRPHPRVHHHLWTRHPACCGTTEVGVTMNG